ncbi:MAG: transcription-repair coupling factor [Gammaproteobacteria bacterium]
MPDTQALQSPLRPSLDFTAGRHLRWGQLYGCGAALVMSQAARAFDGLVVVITHDARQALLLEEELQFFLAGSGIEQLNLPDWETLAYDSFSPHQDIISERLRSLYRLPRLHKGILLLPVQTLMQRLPPRAYLDKHCLLIESGQKLDLSAFRLQLDQSGYQCVSSVIEHGEFAVRGSILDLFPMGSPLPLRIELFDDEIESIRSFDPESQRSLDKVEKLELLPAREFPVDPEAISRFRQNFRSQFEGDPQRSLIYHEVSKGMMPGGIEYYFPLFHEQTATLFDYLPDNTLVFSTDELEYHAEHQWQEIQHRHDEYQGNIERPPLAPIELFLRSNEIFAGINRYPRIDWQVFASEHKHGIDYATAPPPQLTLNMHDQTPSAALQDFAADFPGRILFVAESVGRRESLYELLKNIGVRPSVIDGWQDFLQRDDKYCLVVSPLEQGLIFNEQQYAIITEPQIYGQRVFQRRRRKTTQRDTDAIIRNLAELTPQAPVVHEQYGVGRFLGLQTLTTANIETEFLVLEYADGDKLYVPVASLHLISRYTGAAPESAPLHKLGSGQWERARRKARERIRDVAAELLEIYAMREARQGYQYTFDAQAYERFAAEFPFEETPDQQAAIDGVIEDMESRKPMDRLVCGDVGFGKTEVAMRAAFIAVMAGKQVAILAPTTLLTQQHAENFKDRFADWPVNIDYLSRFKSPKEVQTVLAKIKDGSIDIVIGTHKLLQGDVKYKNLGLVIIDEEHRFGVRQKERFKALRAEVDVLTLTATPIPRTLNMAMAGMRDLSIIATPPAKRLAIKTFVSKWNSQLIQESCLRELHRGGQIYYVHNEVETIENEVNKLRELLPDASIDYAHGQMRERQLEQIMSDFYHQRFNILVCTTIIETGIDIPTANTIIINRADKFGLAQLYQLRGRVGRSHHRAYAYLIIPERQAISADAKKRLEAIESINTLGTGFTLATHDLEIRGAGELLGEGQSGQMHEIGYTLYTELLERAIASLKRGQPIEDDIEVKTTEIELHIPALIPDDYLPDVHERLVLYKRIASSKDKEALRELKVEMIDRFGLLPEPVKNLFQITQLKQQATQLGIKRIDMSDNGGGIIFGEQPDINPAAIIELIQRHASIYKLDGQHKLRVSRDMDTAEARFQEVQTLLDRLGN